MTIAAHERRALDQVDTGSTMLHRLSCWRRQPATQYAPPTSMAAKSQETDDRRIESLQPSRAGDDDRAIRLEMALRRSEKLAMAGRLAASVMHEINNPAQVISDLVYLLTREADRPDSVRARAAQIEEQLVTHSI